MAEKIKIGTLCWAKMKGFAPWPGQVVEPPDTCKKSAKNKAPQHCIFFFGTNNYAWIEDTQIKPYEKYKEEFSKTPKAGVKDAIKAIEKFIKEGGKIASPPAEEQKEDDEFEKVKQSTVGEDTDANDSASEKAASKKPRKVVKKRKEKDIQDEEELVPEKRTRLNDSLLNGSTSSILNHTSPIKKSIASVLIDRPAAGEASSVELDVHSISETLKEKNITPSAYKFGFLGLGVMGGGIVKNLLNSGHSVIVWNRSPEKCDKFKEAGAEIGQTPSDVIAASDITFSCVSDPQAAKEMVFGNCGVMSSISTGKGYVEMTTIDPTTSAEIAEAITSEGGRYLEAQIEGSRSQADEGTLIVLAAGDRVLFDDCQSCFQAISRHSFFLGSVGNAARMALILNMINGIALAGLTEGLALAERTGVQQTDLIEVLQHTQIASPLLVEKGKAVIEGGFTTNQALSLMQKDLRLCLDIGDKVDQPLPLCASANEIYKHAKRLGYGDHDVSAVYIRARF